MALDWTGGSTASDFATPDFTAAETGTWFDRLGSGLVNAFEGIGSSLADALPTFLSDRINSALDPGQNTVNPVYVVAPPAGNGLFQGNTLLLVALAVGAILLLKK